MNPRVALAKKLTPQVAHTGNILILGCGAVARASLPLLFQLVAFDPKKLTIIDFNDTRECISHYLRQGATFIQEKLSPENYKAFLRRHVKKGDLILDLAWNVDTIQLLDYCHTHGILYVNTSLEEWDPYIIYTSRQQGTLYARHQEMRAMIRTWKDLEHSRAQPTAIIDHGANPGFISHLVKKGITDIVLQKLIPGSALAKTQKEKLLACIKNDYFNLIAQEIGLKVIHISERDTQISSRRKQEKEFVNTWSVEGLMEEGLAPAELGWGTHEKTLPQNALTHATGNKSQICLTSRGLETHVKSWIKSGPITGMLLRHGEAYSISDRFAVFAEETPTKYVHSPLRHTDRTTSAIYRPTVHYVYSPCQEALLSLQELSLQTARPQKEQRILYNDIISGSDELGCLLMGSFGLWWTGSLLDIHETRELIDPHKNEINATTLQVASSALASVIYALRHPNIGVCTADDIDHREILELATPFWGPIWSGEITLSPEEASKIQEYQFTDFIVSHIN